MVTHTVVILVKAGHHFSQQIPDVGCRKKSLKALNHEGHEGHEGKEKVFLRALRVLRGSRLFRAFCDAFLRGCKRAWGSSIKKQPQTPLSSCTGIVQDPLHREVNARTDDYPCQMGSVQSL